MKAHSKEAILHPDCPLLRADVTRDPAASAGDDRGLDDSDYAYSIVRVFAAGWLAMAQWPALADELGKGRVSMSGEAVLSRAGGAFDYTPSAVLSGGGSAAVGFEAATATLRALYRADNPRAEAAGLFIVSAFDDELRAAALRSAPGQRLAGGRTEEPRSDAYWRRWLAGVRDASVAVCDAYWSRFCAGGLANEADCRLRMMVSMVEALKWSACDCCGPDEVLWSRLSALLADAPESKGMCIDGDIPGIGREYTRAFALHSAALDRLELPVAVAVFHLVELCLPLLSLRRAAGQAPQYVASPPTAPVPRRQVRPNGTATWHFVPWAAEELLAAFEVRLSCDDVPPALDRASPACYLAAVMHLRRAWSLSPAVRGHRRYSTTGVLSVARGVEECRDCVRDREAPIRRLWHARDVGYGGASAFVPCAHAVSLPTVDELLGMRFEDGDGWHLYVVRRLVIEPEGITFGMQSLSRQVSACRLEDGARSMDALLCDQPHRGQVVRLVMARPLVRLDKSIALVSGGHRLALHALGVGMTGKGFELHRFQVR